MTVAEALARGLTLDPMVRAAGYNDGFAGAPWRPAKDQDWLSYADGYLDGETCRRALARSQPRQ